MARPFKAPIEVVEGATPYGLRQVSLAIALATVMAAALGSQAMLDWAAELPVGPFSDFTLSLAEPWHAAVSRLGFNEPAAALRALISRR